MSLVLRVSLIWWNTAVMAEACTLWGLFSYSCYHCVQRSSKRVSPEKEGLRAMPRESCRAVGESEQDVDQRTQVAEGVVLPEGVVNSELVICSISVVSVCRQSTCSNTALFVIHRCYDWRDQFWLPSVTDCTTSDQVLKDLCCSHCTIYCTSAWSILLPCELFCTNVWLLCHVVSRNVCYTVCFQHQCTQWHTRWGE